MSPDPLPARRTVRLDIRGTVQGVGFRNWTQRLARQLGLAGWVRNRPDGSVEAVFNGPVAAVEEAIRRCRRGPASASVAGVGVSEESGETGEGFEVRPTG